MSDHVHLLVRFAADLSPAVLAREVKARSSKWLHEEVPGMRECWWQRGYGGFTVSRSGVAFVEASIRDQEARHRSMGFKEEFLLLLERHGVGFDPRYVFE